MRMSGHGDAPHRKIRVNKTDDDSRVGEPTSSPRGAIAQARHEPSFWRSVAKHSHRATPKQAERGACYGLAPSTWQLHMPVPQCALHARQGLKLSLSRLKSIVALTSRSS